MSNFIVGANDKAYVEDVLYCVCMHIYCDAGIHLLSLLDITCQRFKAVQKILNNFLTGAAVAVFTPSNFVTFCLFI